MNPLYKEHAMKTVPRKSANIFEENSHLERIDLFLNNSGISGCSLDLYTAGIYV